MDIGKGHRTLTLYFRIRTLVMIYRFIMYFRSVIVDLDNRISTNSITPKKREINTMYQGFYI